MNCNECGSSADLMFNYYNESAKIPLCRTCATRKAQSGEAQSMASYVEGQKSEAQKRSEEVSELKAFRGKRQKTLDSWRNWFKLGGEDDKASPMSGYEIMFHCKTDIRKANKRLKEHEGELE